MDKAAFEAIDNHVDLIAETLEELLKEDQFAVVRRQLADLSRILNGCSISLSVTVEVFDEERGQSLPLLRTGLASIDGAPPQVVYGDSSPQKYIVNGSMAIVPHDYCPSCWGPWDFKLLHRECPTCGVKLGEEVKLLLDTNRCPHCEEETVSPSELICRHCNYEVEASVVVWG